MACIRRVIRVLAPVTVYHLIWRGFRHREYFQRWNERYASYRSARGSIDALAARGVGGRGQRRRAAGRRAARARTRDWRWLVTTITPTGSARVRALWGDGVQHVYLPYDLPGAVARFLDHYRPRLALVMETELWPNLLFGCRDRGIPTDHRSTRGCRSVRCAATGVLAPLIARAMRTLRPHRRAIRGRCGAFHRAGRDARAA